MASEKILNSKKQQVEELTEKLKNAAAGVLVDYKGINVEADTKLRKQLREAGVEYAVIKNTILGFASKNAGFSELEEVLVGTTAIAISNDDQLIAAKILGDFAKKNEKKFKIKAGFIEGKVISGKDVHELADLPSKEVLVARVLYGFNAPISGFANVLNANLRGLAVALNAIAEKKGA